jgi:multicomponent Na+:H+ antiporter subunit E
MKNTFTLVLSLAVFWLLSSDQYSTLILSLGLLSIVLVFFIAHRMNVVDHEYHKLHFSVKFPGYFFWFIKELVLSNITVVKCIWLGNNTISPTLTTVKATQNTEVGKVIYANCITMTPGTVTVELVGDQLLVHALQKETIAELNAGEMDRRITQLESS